MSQPDAGRDTAAAAKPTIESLGIDPAGLNWQRSGDGEAGIEVSFVADPGQPGGWVLMRVTGDPDQRVLVYDRHEWVCFLDGVHKGEFDDAAR